MRIAALIARYLLALMFLVFGFNGFFHFITMPPMPGLPGQFMGAVFASHMYVVIFLLQIICGLLFLIGRYVPLALVLLGPILVNILLFHFLFGVRGSVTGLVCTGLELFLIWMYRECFLGLFEAAPKIG